MNEMIMDNEYETETEDAIDTEEPVVYLYVENSTGYIYQCQFFNDFVLYRPATPGFETVVVKADMLQFLDEFTEYAGSYQDFYDSIRGNVPWHEQPFVVSYR